MDEGWGKCASGWGVSLSARTPCLSAADPVSVLVVGGGLSEKTAVNREGDDWDMRTREGQDSWECADRRAEPRQGPWDLPRKGLCSKLDSRKCVQYALTVLTQEQNFGTEPLHFTRHEDTNDRTTVQLAATGIECNF